MSDLRRTGTCMNSLCGTTEGCLSTSSAGGPLGGMKRSTTMVHRTRRGNSIACRTIPVLKSDSGSDAGVGSQLDSINSSLSSAPGSHHAVPLTTSVLGASTAGPLLSSVASVNVFESIPFEEQEIIEETGESSSDESESEDDLRRKKSQLRLFPTASHTDKEVELEEELSRAATNLSCNLSRLECTVVPSKVLHFVHLEDLSLAENKLGPHLDPEVFKHLKKLKKVNLMNNHLRHLPIELFQLPQLEILLLDQNHLVELPFDSPEKQAAVDVPVLTSFGAEWNKLKQFPTTLLKNSQRLSAIFLAENEFIQEFPTLDVLNNVTVPVKCKVDNRPLLVAKWNEWEQASTIPRCFQVEWNKIYPDLVPVEGKHFLYLGSLRTAQCTEVYKDLNIRYVLTAGRGLQVKLSEGMEQLELGIDDLPGEDMKPFFTEAFDFINQAKENNEGILIHCFAGMSRSVTFTCAYLMSSMAMTRDEALAYVRRFRPAACPNEGFMRGLLQFEKILLAERLS